ncbi:hypothetical protein KAFR_0E00890 [Kazachstania africana CBS 2517]|uniref:Uncharacterized protein n=1 Tax=Kazachstania africana (strain ATCC 22294 / BCRC 22015 / CBS 2517 / CECT 1963 / NBRC 1671 / NRRL Y-8276) TaxID=1071382 RepID=H2AV43_KAZAF|nr:hypothetical protein KAFR_0E00890 [Kazachstania africana CBS 2517]CCF58243.1 hypothetical protein KAFR_0E00890 [Kazachstania africana CBS 2517]
MEEISRTSSVKRIYTTNEDDISNVDEELDYEDEEFNEDEFNDEVGYLDIPRTLPKTDIFAEQHLGLLRSQIPRTQSLSSSYPKGSPFRNLSSTSGRTGSLYTDMEYSNFEGLFDAKLTRTISSNGQIKRMNTRNSYRHRNTLNTSKLETRPNIDGQDKLCLELRGLEEVKRSANETSIYDGFPEGFEDKLFHLRQTHSKLIQILRDRNVRLEEEKRRLITANTITHVISTHTASSTMDESVNTSTAIKALSKPNRVEMNTITDEYKYAMELAKTLKDLE